MTLQDIIQEAQKEFDEKFLCMEKHNSSIASSHENAKKFLAQKMEEAVRKAFEAIKCCATVDSIEKQHKFLGE